MLKAKICNPIVFAAGVEVINKLSADGHNQTQIITSAGRKTVAKNFLEALKKRKFPIKEEDEFLCCIKKTLKTRTEKTGQNNFSSNSIVTDLASLLDKSCADFFGSSYIELAP